MKILPSFTAALLLAASLAPMSAQTPPETYYLYLGNHPDERNPGWHVEVQGIGHDQDHWFITQKDYLWRIPVSHDLSVSVWQWPGDVLRAGILRTNLGDVPQLAGYNHFGDLECFEPQGYLVVAIEDLVAGTTPAIAVFRADNLEYVAHRVLPLQVKAPWAAVDAAGYVYSSDNNDVRSVFKYRVDWNVLAGQGRLELTPIETITLYTTDGAILRLDAVQGGVFSPSGDLLYLSAGSNEGSRATDGLHVFDLRTGRRVQRSMNGSGYFNYAFDTPNNEEEPEGLTIWDLDNGRAPGISGQLHVLLLDNDEFPRGDDDVYLKHYTHTITVDRGYVGAEEGTPQQPFNTVEEAHTLAWPGANIAVRAGSYPETLSLTKRVTLLAANGAATIGR